MKSHPRLLALSLLTAAALIPAARIAAAQTQPAPPPPAAQAPATPPAQNPPAQPPADSQEPALQERATPQDANNQPFTLKTAVNEVNLIFTVTDKHGHFVKDLRQQDFSLLDDRKQPERVYSFTQQTDLPLRVGLLIDASTSIRQRFKFEQDAAAEFLLQVIRPHVDKAFVMGFDVTPDIVQDFSDNQDLLDSGIHKLRPGGGTALYDAVYTACRDKLLPSVREREAVRKAIILVSDGEDNQSRARLDDTIKMCQRAEAIIYAISTNNSPTRDRGDEVLKQLAENTGGTAFFPDRIENIALKFHDIEDELRSQYSLVYKPADFKADNSYRTIYLVANDRRYIVRSHKGYYTPKE